ncbi:phage tail assembly protein [Massilia sp. YIM B02763]|uniref:phage tail assembly protein n=1 Tax=Massilia sp. YIM B02763 TaxID=3050130 RepID=UPI0025B6E9F0|nr:phage tail assembly protein [Massilia sp. YIM B02763]MDN4056349.1 phage tail assembly protein [Massilia sp. YIM B02763]
MSNEKNPNTVELDTPIKRGTQEITEVTLRKPSAGELRGVSLQAICNFDVDALLKVLPRVTTPALTAHEVHAMDPADLIQMGDKFAGFLAPKKAMADFLASQTE